MDDSSIERSLEDPNVLEAQKEVERLLNQNNPSPGQPPWEENLKELVKWATEYVVQEHQSQQRRNTKARGEPNEGGDGRKYKGKIGSFLGRLLPSNMESRSQPGASTSQHDSREGRKVQPEQDPESKAPKQLAFKMFQPVHLQEFWSRNLKWVTDYFVNAQKHPRLETIVRSMMQVHMASQQSFFSTVTGHVNSESDTVEVTSPDQTDGEEESKGEAAGGAAAEEEAEVKTEEKVKENIADEEEAEQKAEEEGSSEAGDELSDADKKSLFQDLQDVVKQHLLKGFLDVYWTMLNEYALIQDANHMLFMERLRTSSTAPSEHQRHHPAQPTDLSLVFPQVHHQSVAPGATPSSSMSEPHQAQEDAEAEEEEEWINNRAAGLREIYLLLTEDGAKQLAECEKELYKRADFLNGYDDKMRGRTHLLIFK